jgi:hypothetical protein
VGEIPKGESPKAERNPKSEINSKGWNWRKRKCRPGVGGKRIGATELQRKRTGFLKRFAGVGIEDCRFTVVSRAFKPALKQELMIEVREANSCVIPVRAGYQGFS